MKTKSDTKQENIVKREQNEVFDAEELVPQITNSIPIKSSMRP